MTYHVDDLGFDVNSLQRHWNVVRSIQSTIRCHYFLIFLLLLLSIYLSPFLLLSLQKIPMLVCGFVLWYCSFELFWLIVFIFFSSSCFFDPFYTRDQVVVCLFVCFARMYTLTRRTKRELRRPPLEPFANSQI